MPMTNVTIPFLGANDDNCLIVDLLVKNGAYVKKGEILFVLETTKSAMDVEAESEGYFFSSLKVGERKNYGQLVAVIAESENEQAATLELIAAENDVKEKNQGGVRITKKAEMIMQRNGLDIEKIILFADGLEVNEALINQYLQEFSTKNKKIGLEISNERIAVIGGVSGGGALIIIDSVLRSAKQVVMAVYDNDKVYHGKEVLGVPVMGGEDKMIADFKDGKFQAIVIAFNRNLDERQTTYERYKSMGLRFTNVIDQTVELRMGVEIGEGNVILAKTYIAACTVIGNNNFISSNVCIEHGNSMGSHNAFGPGVFTSGNVVIKNKIRFGTGVFIEPNLIIGDNVTLGSFVFISSNIPDNTVIKKKTDYIIKEK